MDDLPLNEALEELESAEDFLNYFGIAFDAAVVQVNRLHILQRYHNYLAQAGAMPAAEDDQRTRYTELLTRAYQDFVTSDALTEKVFKVFHMHEPQTAFVPLSSITVSTPKTQPLPPATGGCGCGNTGACHSSEAALRG
jgi:nitrogenase-stabilizing/protective protein